MPFVRRVRAVGGCLPWLLVAGGVTAAPHPPILAPAVEGIAELQPGWATYVAPEFPFALRNTTLQGGFAVVAYTFDEDGRIADRLVLSASHPAFGDAVCKVMPAWRINLRDYPARARRDMRAFEFQRRGVIMSGSQREAARSAFNPAGDAAEAPLTTWQEAELDAPLDLVAGGFPAFPDAMRDYADEGEVILEFVVDEAGRARVPAVLSATNPTFAAAALAHLPRWRFTIPQKRGHPAQAFLTRSVQFSRRQP